MTILSTPAKALSALFLILPLIAGAMNSPPDAAANRTAQFAQPARNYQAKFRWWWPHGLVDPAQLASELEAMAEAGFGGAEIADVHHSVRHQLDPAGHGWGTPAWSEAVKVALRTAADLGMKLDLTVGPSWPAALPTITPNSPAAVTELAVGISGTPYRGPVPPPLDAPHRRGTKQTPLYLQAARVIQRPSEKDGEIVLDGDSVIDLNVLLEEPTIAWESAEEGDWILISYWQRGSGQQPERGPHTEPESYVVDHFSTAGTEAIVDFWETHILDNEMRSLIRESGEALFEDSLELETDATHWTPGLAEIFEERCGYALLPFLPIIAQRDEDPIFQYADFDPKPIEHDYWKVLGDLYLERHQAPLQAWAAGLGLKLRTQPYGLPTDAMLAAAHLDIAEGESLGFKNLDDYRSLAGGRDMGGHKILSNEAAAFAGGAYGTTWQKVLRTLNPIFAAGVNQTVLHGFAYAEVPDVHWPGFAAFSPYGGNPGYAEAWGPRTPNWQHAADVAGYFARVQWVLQQGVPQVDVAFLRQKGYAGSGFGAPWFSRDGYQLGWTHEFVSPSLLDLPAATMRDQRLAPDGPAFRVLLFEGHTFAGKRCSMPAAAAEQLAAFAQAGLPMILVGDWSNPTTSGRPTPEELARLKRSFEIILEQSKVVNIPDRSGIEDAVRSLDLPRAVNHPKATLVNAHRRDGSIDYFFFANDGKAPIEEHPVTIRPTHAQAQPFRLDPWMGRIHTLEAEATTGPDGQITLPLSLAPGDAALFAFAPEGSFLAAETIPSTTPPEKGRLELTGWSLTVESWTPGAKPTLSAKSTREMRLDGLHPWAAIEGLEDVSGIGRYQTTVEIPAAVLAATAVYLDLGQHFDTARVSINGQALPPFSPLDPVIEVREWLVPGSNTIEIEVTTTLNNALRVHHAEVFSRNRRQDYGLVGPVILRW